MSRARRLAIWDGRCRPHCCCGSQPATCLARSGLYSGRVRRRRRDGPPALSAIVGRRIFARPVWSARAARSSLCWRRSGCRVGDPHRRPLDHQSSRHDRCPSVCIAHTIFCLGGRRHVGAVCRCGSGSGCDCGQRSPCSADRGNHGDRFKSSALRIGSRRNGESFGRPSGVGPQFALKGTG